MSAAQIINSFQLAGLLGGGYLGYRYGYPVWKKHILPKVKSQYNDKWISQNFNITEEQFFSICGGLLGVAGGYYIWPISATLAGLVVYKDISKMK